jgi:hypothetical protein
VFGLFIFFLVWQRYFARNSSNFGGFWHGRIRTYDKSSAAILGTCAYVIAVLQISFYTSYTLPKRFGISTQSKHDALHDQTKRLLLRVGIGLGLAYLVIIDCTTSGDSVVRDINWGLLGILLIYLIIRRSRQDTISGFSIIPPCSSHNHNTLVTLHPSATDCTGSDGR